MMAPSRSGTFLPVNRSGSLSRLQRRSLARCGRFASRIGSSCDCYGLEIAGNGSVSKPTANKSPALDENTVRIEEFAHYRSAFRIATNPHPPHFVLATGGLFVHNSVTMIGGVWLACAAPLMAL